MAAVQKKSPHGALAFTPWYPVAARSGRLLAWITVILLTPWLAVNLPEGYNEPFHRDALWGREWLVGITLATCFYVWWTLRVIRDRITQDRFPAPLGTYLLPLDVVEITGPTLRVYPIEAMTGCQATDAHHPRSGVYAFTSLSLTFPSATVTFMTDRQGAADIQGKLAHYQGAARDAVTRGDTRGDTRALWELDPLYEARSSPAWSSLQRVDVPPPEVATGPSLGGREPPRWLRHPSLIALALGLVVGPTVWFARNRLSDDAMYDFVRGNPTLSVCERYIGLGGRHAEAVRVGLLPGAAYRATPRDNVLALREFIQRNPRNPHVGEARARIHQLFDEARASWLRQASTREPGLVPFMTRLLAWEEAHESSVVRMRFFPPSSGSLATVDGMAAGRADIAQGRVVAPIAPHFTVATMRPREGRVVNALSFALGAVFQHAMLPLEDGGRLAEGAAPPDDAPVFDVSYLVTPSGALYTVDNLPGRTFIGMLFAYRVTMRVPDGGAPFTFVFDVRPERDISFQRRTGERPDDAFVYGVMSDSAFTQLTLRFRAVFFQSAVEEMDRRAAALAASSASTDPPVTNGDPTRRHRHRRRH